MEKIQKWTALYLPARTPGYVDPSRFDFNSEPEAQEYIFSQMCRGCQEERDRAVKKITIGVSDENIEHEYDSLWPACACEWDTMLTSEYEQCETDQDVMEAAGWEVIYSKDGEAQEVPVLDLKSWPGMTDAAVPVLKLSAGPVVTTPTIITKL